MKKFDIHVQKHTLIFRESDGWTHDLMESILSTGKIYFRNGEWMLSQNHGVSCFDERRLEDLVRDVYRGLQIVSLRERAHCLKYYSTVGVFEFGDRADAFGRGKRF